MNKEIIEFTEAVAAKPPEAFYDTAKKEFLIQDIRGCWIGLAETQFKRVLRQKGISPRVDEKTGLSPQDEAILHYQQDRNVMWAGPLAGYRTGFLESGGTRVLVTTSPCILESVEGDWSMLRSVIEGVLGDGNGEQVSYFLAWLKIGYEALRAGKCQPGQAIVFVGEHCCGKSLIQQLITVVLGGRTAKPYQMMVGASAFNADLFGAEHLMIEDEFPSSDIRARRAFGSQIKSLTVNVDQRLHAKHRDALTLRPFWRLSVSLNDEPENLQVLPPVDDSLADKMILLKAVRHPMPMPTATAAERAAFWECLVSEVPAMLGYLVGMEIPAEFRSERFGVKHFHHPEILQKLDEVAPEFRLLALIDTVLFGGTDTGLVKVERPGVVEATAEEIERVLTIQYSGCEHEARRLFSWNNACGTYLGRLAKRLPDRVQQLRTSTVRRWRIIRAAAEGPTPAAPTPAVPMAAGGAGAGAVGPVSAGQAVPAEVVAATGLANAEGKAAA